MTRYEIIKRIGDMYQTGNTESGEWSYPSALRSVGKNNRWRYKIKKQFGGLWECQCPKRS